MKLFHRCLCFVIFMNFVRTVPSKNLLTGQLIPETVKESIAVLKGIEGTEVNLFRYFFYPLCQTDPVERAVALTILKPFDPLVPITNKDVKFLLYTRKNRIAPKIILGNEPASSMKFSGIDFTKETVLYCDGYYASHAVASALFPSALLPQKDVNIIIVDWDNYAFYEPLYTSNVTVPRLGNIIGTFLKKLNNIGADPKKITLMGFSSGSQAVGLAAKQISPKIARIFGFSPDASCYDFVPDDQKLIKGDADYVIIVHCTSGIFEYTLNYLGDATFYVNGGLIQPHCTFVPTPFGKNICSHYSCAYLLYYSLRDTKRFVGVKCDSYSDYLNSKCDCSDTAVLNFDLPDSVKGLYFINTALSFKEICSKSN